MYVIGMEKDYREHRVESLEDLKDRTLVIMWCNFHIKWKKTGKQDKFYGTTKRRINIIRKKRGLPGLKA